MTVLLQASIVFSFFLFNGSKNEEPQLCSILSLMNAFLASLLVFSALSTSSVTSAVTGTPEASEYKRLLSAIANGFVKLCIAFITL